MATSLVCDVSSQVPAFKLTLPKLVALQEDDRASAFAAGGGHVITNAEVAPEYVDPDRFEDRRTLLARHRYAARHVLDPDDFSRPDCWGYQRNGQGDCECCLRTFRAERISRKLRMIRTQK